ncbi:MAG: hypothetical protein JWL72_2911 [Ilumatobacteraceae bacterium]|nr:hypothetical protein [Ilumatobacteraceae bacterium]MCU1389573.1 hypothetical protein [Ilumatobacteraceae bacterium]
MVEAATVQTARVTVGRAILLVLAGIGGGLAGSIAGLASLFSYPVLLAIGLPPVTANVTNTVSLVFSSTGSISGSRPELVGQGPRVRQLAIAGLIGGALGALLLLATPADSFERVVPVLIAGASVAILARRKLVDEVVTDGAHRVGPRVVVGVGVVGIYGGYFGAGAGVMLLALLLLSTGDPLPRCNAVKNVVLGLANGIAAVGFAIFGPVRWSVVLPLGLGLFIGGRIGPTVVRRSPARVLRIVIAIAGLGLAVKLGYDTYR